jgi:hypothetical protein
MGARPTSATPWAPGRDATAGRSPPRECCGTTKRVHQNRLLVSSRRHITPPLPGYRLDRTPQRCARRCAVTPLAMAGLTGHVDARHSFVDQQRDERVAQVVKAPRDETGRLCRRQKARLRPPGRPQASRHTEISCLSGASGRMLRVALVLVEFSRAGHCLDHHPYGELVGAQAR